MKNHCELNEECLAVLAKTNIQMDQIEKLFEIAYDVLRQHQIVLSDRKPIIDAFDGIDDDRYYGVMCQIYIEGTVEVAVDMSFKLIEELVENDFSMCGFTLAFLPTKL